MMTKEKFKELMYKIQEYNEFLDKLLELGIDIYNSKFAYYADEFFDDIMRNEFGDDGMDLISWWLYEDVDHKIYEHDDNLKEWYYPEEEIEGKVIADLNDIDALYDYLTQDKKEEQ